MTLLPGEWAMARDGALLLYPRCHASDTLRHQPSDVFKGNRVVVVCGSCASIVELLLEGYP